MNVGQWMYCVHSGQCSQSYETCVHCSVRNVCDFCKMKFSFRNTSVRPLFGGSGVQCTLWGSVQLIFRTLQCIVQCGVLCTVQCAVEEWPVLAVWAVWANQWGGIWSEKATHSLNPKPLPSQYIWDRKTALTIYLGRKNVLAIYLRKKTVHAIYLRQKKLL